MSAVVDAVPGGVRVTLRPHGWGRWVMAAFMAFWLCGWAAGEVFAGGALLALLGLLPHSISRPPLALSLGAGSFILVWLVLWTFGGVSAIHTVLRLFWGRDEITLLSDGWTLRQCVGRWGKTVRFPAAEVDQVGVRRKDQALVVEMGGKTHVLAHLGTEADRYWLQSRLREILDACAPSGSALKEAPRELPGWRVRTREDGSVLFTRAPGNRLAAVGCIGFFALFWNGIVGTAVLAGLKVVPTRVEGGAGLVFWMFLTPFIAIGALLLWGVVWTLWGREEWRACPGRLELCRRLWGWERTRTVLSGRLEVEVSTDSDGDETWSLVLQTETGKQVLERGSPADLRALGTRLAQGTGWPYRAADDLLMMDP